MVTGRMRDKNKDDRKQNTLDSLGEWNYTSLVRALTNHIISQLFFLCFKNLKSNDDIYDMTLHPTY